MLCAVMTLLSLYQTEASELGFSSFFSPLSTQSLWLSQAETESSVSVYTEVFPQIFQRDLRPGFYWVIQGLSLPCPAATAVIWKGCDLI